MAYDVEELKRKAIKIVKEDLHVVFQADIYTKLGISYQTFYNLKLDKFEELKELLQKNKTDIKESLRKKWFANNNATLQIALYKLTAQKEELAVLNNLDGEADAKFNLIIKAPKVEEIE